MRCCASSSASAARSSGRCARPTTACAAEVVKSVKLQAIIKDLAGEGEKERRVLTARAYAMLRELEAQPEPARHSDRSTWPSIPSFNRIYDGVEVDQEGLERVREAAKRGTLVLLPSHKSHVDYLMLSFVFSARNLQLPLIAAGDNLAFFPLGLVLRRGGGVLHPPHFGGDRLYAAVVDAYIRRLIRDGYSIEFFLEGGRSRTGKLLPPKLGLLNMVVDAALAVPNKERLLRPGVHRLRAARRGERVRSRADRRREAEGGRPRPAQDHRRSARALRPPQHPVRRDPLAARHPQRTATAPSSRAKRHKR